MIVCFLHAKVGHCQAIYIKPAQAGLQKTLLIKFSEGFIVCTS
jgi:hypothetical protein